MTYLISQLWLYLLCAGLLGLFLGWIIWGWWNRRLIAEAKADYERERLALEQKFETDKVALQEDRTAAFLARDEAINLKASLVGELEGEREAIAEAKAQIGRLTQADMAARGESERNLAALQQQLEQERSTAAEAKQAVDAIRADMQVQLQQERTAHVNVKDAHEKLRAELKTLGADANRKEAAFRASLEEERKAKDSLDAELQHERAELTKAKDAIGDVRTEMNRQVQAKQAALASAENAASAAKRDVETARGELARFKAENVKASDAALKALEESLSEERRAKATIEVELRRERAELSEAKDAIDEARAEASRQVQAKQTALAAQESEANLKAEMARTEIERLRSAQGKVGVASVQVQQLQAKVDQERKAKDVAEADRSRLIASEREAKAEIERLRSQLSVLSTKGQGYSGDAERLPRELSEARERQQKLDAEIARLRKLLSERETVSVKPAGKQTFTTDAPRPASLFDRRPDTVDDLKEVRGIGPVMERILNENGCYHFKQLANFSPRDIEWISQALGSFPDRIERDNWVGQAKTLYFEKYGQRHDIGEVRTLETVS